MTTTTDRDIRDKNIHMAVDAFIDEQGEDSLIRWYNGHYSGRGMYNRTCMAVIIPDHQMVGHLFFHLGAANETGDFTLDHRIFDTRTDNYGTELVLYWPWISAPNLDEEEDESDPTEDNPVEEEG